MSVKREFGENQSSEPMERTAPRDHANPAGGKPEGSENIDNLVSSFLAQLTDLTSRMNQNDSGSESGRKQKPVEFKMPQFGLEESADSSEPVDLKGIDDEIEKSIAELEDLTSGKALPKPVLLPEKPPEPGKPPKGPPPPAEIAIPADPEELAWNRLELFRTNISSRRLTPGRMKTLGAAGLVIAAAIAVFLLFRSEITTEPVSQKAIAEPAEQGSGPVVASSLPANSESPPAVNTVEKSGRPSNSEAKSGRNKPAPAAKTVARADGATESRPRSNGRNGSSGNGSGNRRSMEASLNGFPAVKPAVNEEAPRPAAPTAAAVSPVPDQVSRVDIPPPTAPEPKPDPVPPPAPAKVPAENGPAAAPAAASLRETPPPDPKPVPVDLETQPKIRAVVLAEIVKKVQAQYPIIARSQRVSGQVDVEAEINDKGDVVQARAVSGPILLRNAAEEAVRKWKYKPASIGGVNVSSKARVTVNFNLQ